MVGRDQEFGGKRIHAHRLSYILNVGSIPDELCVCHTCDNPLCVRPDHLWLGTKTENTADRTRKGRTASGDAHGMRQHPESIPRGDRSGRRLHPENYPDGDQHWTRRKPELLHRGEGHQNAKLTADDVRTMRRLYELGAANTVEIAKRYRVNNSTVSGIVRRVTWKHVE